MKMNKKIIPILLLFIGLILITTLLYLYFLSIFKNYEDSKTKSEPMIVEKESINSVNIDTNRGLTQFDRHELNHVYNDNDDNIIITESFEDIITRHIKSFNYFLDQYIDNNNNDKVRDYVHYRVFDRSIKDNDTIKSSPVITIRDVSVE